MFDDYEWAPAAPSNRVIPLTHGVSRAARYNSQLNGNIFVPFSLSSKHPKAEANQSGLLQTLPSNLAVVSLRSRCYLAAAGPPLPLLDRSIAGRLAISGYCERS